LSASVWGVLFAAIALVPLIVGYEAAMHFTGVAIDGPFQLLNALRRIDAGYRAGVDFQFFHGLGIPFLHYPFYRMLGGGLRGSELPRELIAGGVYPATFLFFFRAFTGSWRRAAALAAAAMAVSLTVRMSAMVLAVNGMLGLRSALPALIPAVFLVLRPSRWRALILGVAIGLALFLSTEQGTAITLAFAIVTLAEAALRRDRTAAIDAVIAVAVAILVLVTALVMVGGFAGARGALHFNFGIVPLDQYWFFGAPPNVFVSSWSSGVRMLVAVPIIGVAVVGSLLAIAWYARRMWRARRQDGANRRDAALAMLALYGLISCGSLLGVFTYAYAQPALRGLIIIILIELDRVGMSADARRGSRGFLHVPRLDALIAAAALVIGVVETPMIPVALTVSLPHIIADHVFGNERFSMGGIWPATLPAAQTIVDAHRAPQGQPPALWSTYAGWIEARNGIFNPSVDYAIHALGPDGRARYIADFRRTKPALVQTVLPSYTQYEPWLENNDWAFYDELLDAYRIAGMTKWSIFWERRDTLAKPPALVAAMHVPPGLTTVTLPPSVAALSPSTLLEVEIDYTTHNPLHRLPIVGASPRFLIQIEGAVSHTDVSLSPYATRRRFPIVLAPLTAPRLTFHTFSLLPGASWTPVAIRLFARPLDGGASPWLDSLRASLR
jgi:hypothetical protein